MNPWTTKKVKTVYENPWIKVSHEEVLNPSGKEGIYGVVHFKNIAIAIIPLDKNNNTWLVGQYRYPLKAYSWEVPEGGGLIHTDPLESAKRELLEETGITAKKWTKIADMALSNSVSDELGLTYLAQDLSFGEAQPEETEQLKIKKLPFDEIVEMAMNGQITDALSLVSIMKLKLLKDRGEI